MSLELRGVFFINFEQIFIPLGVITWHGMWWALNTYSLCKFVLKNMHGALTLCSGTVLE